MNFKLADVATYMYFRKRAWKLVRSKCAKNQTKSNFSGRARKLKLACLLHRGH